MVMYPVLTNNNIGLKTNSRLLDQYFYMAHNAGQLQ